MLVDDIIIEGLQTMANTYRDKLFPGSNLDSFKFTSFDKGVMKRIASKITENGIDKYLPEEPAENGNRNLDQNRSDLHTIDVDKESQALCARFADRYADLIVVTPLELFLIRRTRNDFKQEIINADLRQLVQAEFSFVHRPFNMKLVWAPIVDTLY
ncbi:conserved hypothetical protein [Culex quinquefasciatus]|uniref:Uncharacterized protein n=2 Tax=Culex pipiens complex TaxID=518105 RepID=B0XF22_CULQU|nr:conserved hypothetical protein [Culex quinquefasciatus]|eukprot:XP_001868244.1 conserved hypothetical protein [Culex quinquefasciatus]